MFRQQACPQGTFPYKIQPGDTLWAIARRFNVTVQEIINVNPNINPNMLFVEQTICIPTPITPQTCPGGRIYIVLPNDNLGSIAQKFNVSLSALRKANPGFNPNRIVPGQRICIPPYKTAVPCQRETYLIQRGDNLISIAEKFTVRVSDLIQFNAQLAPSDFEAGRLICIPRPVEV